MNAVYAHPAFLVQLTRLAMFRSDGIKFNLLKHVWNSASNHKESV